MLERATQHKQNPTRGCFCLLDFLGFVKATSGEGQKVMVARLVVAKQAFKSRVSFSAQRCEEVPQPLFLLAQESLARAEGPAFHELSKAIKRRGTKRVLYGQGWQESQWPDSFERVV